MKKPSLKERILYYFENTMSRGPIGIIKWLALSSLFMVLLLGMLILIFGIKSSPEPEADQLGFLEGAWQSLMATLDSGTMGGDEGWAFRLVRFAATLGGIFLISILIGAISSGIDEKLGELKKGKSRVLETNHTLILGWSDKIFSILSEIIEANSNKKKLAIVILADKDKEEMEDEIRSKITNFKSTKVVVRSGSPLEATDIAVVNPNEARSIIVLANEDQHSDTHVIKSILALTNGKDRKKEDYNIVAEIKNEKNMEAATLVGNNEAVFVLSDDMISRLTAQTSLQSGLSVVYSQLLQFEGDEIYFHQEPKLQGKTYRDALFAFESAAVIGILSINGNVLINPPMDCIIQEGDTLIVIAEDDDKIFLSNSNNNSFSSKSFLRETITTKKQQKVLILGWNDKGIRIIEELENYVTDGSKIQVVAESLIVGNQIDKLKEKVIKQEISFLEGDINDRDTLLNLHPENYDHIILLSYKNMDIQESDAKTLICLLHLRNFSEKLGKDFNIVSEMLDLRNRELCTIAKADDFIVSDNLISLMLSQLSENKQLKKVFDILFEAEGSEIYLKPVNRYVKAGQRIDFNSVVESAAQINETAIGYRISSHSADSEKQYGVRINPRKSEQIVFDANDYIIVLSEDY